MLQVDIGNAHYYDCSCVRYTASDSDDDNHIGLAVGLSAAFALLLVVAVVIVVVVCRKYCNKTDNNGAAFIEMNPNNKSYI